MKAYLRRLEHVHAADGVREQLAESRLAELGRLRLGLRLEGLVIQLAVDVLFEALGEFLRAVHLALALVRRGKEVRRGGEER